jgi:rubrerythrin
MKYKCKVCGYIYDEEKEGTKFADLPDDWKCPVCGVPKKMFEPVEESAPKAEETKTDAPVNTDDLSWASEHVIGVAKDLPEDMKQFLRAEFAGECSEVGMYLAMSRAAIREGYAEIGMFYRQVALEEADHASRYAEMLGEVVSPSTKENLTVRVAAENGATKNKTEFAKKCKQMNLDALHDSIHEMARDEARHGKGFKGLLDRYFG